MGARSIVPTRRSWSLPTAALIYLPHGDASLARRLVSFLSGLDYVGALFADDRYGATPGALALSNIALQGSSKLPRPAIVVS